MHDSDDLNIGRKSFYASTTPRLRQIKEKPILGIDYEKLRYGNRKQALSFIQQDTTPKESLIQNRTASSFRRATPVSRARTTRYETDSILRNQKEKSSRHQNNSVENFINTQIEQQADFDNYKKYQQEFQDFRKQRQMNSTSGRAFSQRRIIKLPDDDQKPPMSARLSKSTMVEGENANQVTFGKMSEKLFQSINKKRQGGDQQSQEQVQTEQIEDKKNNPDSEEDNNNNNQDAVNDGVTNNQSKELENNNDNAQNQPPHQLQQQMGESQQSWFKQNDEMSVNSERYNLHTPSGFDGVSPSRTFYSKLLDKYIEKNPEYFRHLSGDCLCGKCVCDKCKCPYKLMPYDLKRALQSIYQNDFQQPKNLENLPTITMDFFTQHQKLDPINCQSMNQSDYKPHEAHLDIHKAPQSTKVTGPFLSNSTYKSNFINYKIKQAEHVKAPQDVTVSSEIPFVAKSLYMRSFCGDKKAKRDKDFEDFIKNKLKSQFQSPFNPDFRFQPQSTSQKFFQKPSSSFHQESLLKPFAADPRMTPAPPEQFRSIASREYKDKSKVKCQSQLILMDLQRKKKIDKQADYEEYLKGKIYYEKERDPMTMNKLFATVRVNTPRSQRE